VSFFVSVKIMLIKLSVVQCGTMVDKDTKIDPIVEAWGTLIERALEVDPEKFVIDHPCHKGLTLIDECAEARYNGCYCYDFEVWRMGPPKLMPNYKRCTRHLYREPLRRDHFMYVSADHDNLVKDKCWWCILEHEQELADELRK